MISFYRRGILIRKQLCRLPLTEIRTKAEIPQVSDFQIPAGFFALSSGAAPAGICRNRRAVRLLPTHFKAGAGKEISFVTASPAY